MWLYNNSPLEIIPENAYGYVYLITNTITGRKYIGKKLFWFRKTKVVKGNHLTITYNNGYPEKLEWDDEALLRDVREACLKAESVLPVTETKPKRKTKVK